MSNTFELFMKLQHGTVESLVQDSKNKASLRVISEVLLRHVLQALD